MNLSKTSSVFLTRGKYTPSYAKPSSAQTSASYGHANSYNGHQQTYNSKTGTRPKLDVHANIASMIAKVNALKFRKFDVKLYVDHREREFICGLFRQLRPELVVFANLPMADFWIVVNDKILFAFERKRLDDLCASIRERGKRMESQKLNMIELSGLTDRRRGIFLFEKLEPPSGATSAASTNSASASSVSNTDTPLARYAFEWSEPYRFTLFLSPLPHTLPDPLVPDTAYDPILGWENLDYRQLRQRLDAVTGGQCVSLHELSPNTWYQVEGSGTYRGEPFVLIHRDTTAAWVDIRGPYWETHHKEYQELRDELFILIRDCVPEASSVAHPVLNEQVLFTRWQREGLMAYPNEKDPLMNLALGRDAIDGATVKRLIRDRMGVLFSEGQAHTVHLLLKFLQFTHEFGEQYLADLELQPALTMDRGEFEHRALTIQGQVEFLRSRRQTMLESKEEERLSALQFSDAQRLLIRQLCVMQGVTVDPAVTIVQHLGLTSGQEWSEYLVSNTVDDIVAELSVLPLRDTPAVDEDTSARHIGPALVLKMYNLHCGTDYEVCGTQQKRPRILSAAEALQYRDALKAKRLVSKKRRTEEDPEANADAIDHEATVSNQAEEQGEEELETKKTKKKKQKKRKQSPMQESAVVDTESNEITE